MPIADFTADVTEGPVPLTVQFTDQSTGTIDTWEWDFNNDGTIDWYDQAPDPWTKIMLISLSGKILQRRRRCQFRYDRDPNCLFL